MAAFVSFGPGVGWLGKWGRFCRAFEITLGEFASLEMIPSVAERIVPICADGLHEYWPDRFPEVAEEAPALVGLDDVPLEEMALLASYLAAAAEALKEPASSLGLRLAACASV